MKRPVVVTVTQIDQNTIKKEINLMEPIVNPTVEGVGIKEIMSIKRRI